MAAKDDDNVRVIRPLKVIAVICTIIAAIMIFISLITSFWLEGEGFNQGLWQYCIRNKDKETCTLTLSVKDWVWITACGGLCVAAAVATALAVLLIICSLLARALPKKRASNIAAVVAMLTAIICLLAALILFPIVFIQKIEDYRVKYSISHWFFSWSYGITWGSWIFLVGSVILLLIDRDTEKIQNTEKKYYNSSM